VAQKIHLTLQVTSSSVALAESLNGRSCNACPRASSPLLPDRKRLRQPDHHEAQAYYHVLVRPAPPQYLCGPERQGAYAVIQFADDDVRLLRHAALALYLAPRLMREVRPVSAERSQASIKHNSHNDRETKIAVIASKPAVFKAKRGIHLIIVILLASSC
jgi:hypothetical protein